MKKVIAWLLVLTLTATVSIGATLAYLTDTDEDVNVMTLGKVKIDQLEFGSRSAGCLRWHVWRQSQAHRCQRYYHCG